MTHARAAERALSVGVGARRGVSPDEVWETVTGVLREAGLSPRAVSGLATVDVRAAEPGLLGAARRLGVPLRSFPAGVLASVEVPHPSAAAARSAGTPSVAEAAALLAAGRGAGLVMAKRKRPGTDGGPARITVAVAAADVAPAPVTAGAHAAAGDHAATAETPPAGGEFSGSALSGRAASRMSNVSPAAYPCPDTPEEIS